MFRCCRSRVDRAIAFKRERLIICWLGCLCLLSCRGIFRLVGLDNLRSIDALDGSACCVCDGAARSNSFSTYIGRAGHERYAQSQHDG